MERAQCAFRKPFRMPNTHCWSSRRPGGDELLIAAPDGGLFADAEEQVAAKDLLFCDLQLGGDQLFQHAFLGGTAQQGQHIHLLVERSLIVDLAVHVDGNAGDHQQVAVQCHQTGYDSAVLLHQHTAATDSGRSIHVAQIIPP